MKVLFTGLCIFVAIFQPVLVKQLLNVFAMTVLSVIICSLHVNDLGKVCIVEIILFIMSHIFNVNFERQEAISFSPSSFPFTAFLSFKLKTHRQLSD